MRRYFKECSRTFWPTRFQLVLKRELREMPVYAMTVANPER